MNIKLHEYWQVIFGKPIDDKLANQLIDQNIATLQDLGSKFNSSNLVSQQEKEKLQIIKILLCLQLSDEELLTIFQKIVDYGIEQIDHLRTADDDDYKEFGLNVDQQKIILQELNYDSEESQFNQLLIQLVNDQAKVPQLKDKLIEQGITSVSQLLQQQIGQLDGIGINKFKFKTQQQIFNNNKLQISNEQNLQNQGSQQMNQETSDQKKNNILIQQDIPRNKNWISEIQNLKKCSKFIEKKNGFDIYQYPAYKREKLNNVEAYKSMIFIGQTGSGKTTLLNFFLNYYLDIQYKDNFRFVIINEQQGTSQAVSQTQDVHIYYIKPFDGKQGIRLIDTPGFGDTRGLAQDEIIGNQIRKCFKEDVESLSAICFLVQSSNARLTPNQNYILSCILQMFGKDIIKNFVFMLTFCDSGDPKAIDALKFQGDSQNQGCPVAMMIDQIEDPWYLKFNSSALMSPNTDEMINRYFWEIAITSFKDFYNKKLLRNLPQSLILTKEVIREREQLILIIKNLRPKIDEQLHLMENFKSIHQQIQKLDDEKINSQNFEIKSIEYQKKKRYLQKGQYTTNCTKCETTCCHPCTIYYDMGKYLCAAMGYLGYCSQCKCYWNKHKNEEFYYISEQVEIIRELADLKKQYITNKKSTISEKQQILDGIEEEYLEKQADCMGMQYELIKSVNRLKEIAIQPACCKHQEEYIDIMIQEEMQNKKDGFLQRVNQLQELKNNWQFIRETSNNQGGIQITKEFIQKSIPKDKIKKSLWEKFKSIFE